MKKNILTYFLVILLLGIVGLTAAGCSKKESSGPSPASDSKKVKYYTCSMHPSVHADKPGQCPICGMNLVPVYEEANSSQNSSTGATGRSTVHLSPEKQQLIGVKTEVAARKPLSREIHATGRVAFAPDLFIAQSEYLLALKTQPQESVISDLQNNLVKASKLRLELLGMSEEQIRQLSKTRKAQGNLLLPRKGGEVWVYGSLYESDLPWVKTGTPVEVWIPDSSDPQTTKIESLDPVIDPNTRTIQARMPVPNPNGFLKPDMYVKLKILAQTGEVLAIPNDAVLSSGTRKIVFVTQGDGKFEPREVKVGRQGTGWVEIISGISAGEQVVTSANFLLDSESQLKAALSNMDHPETKANSL